MVDHKGRIVMVNQKTERLFGYPRLELIGQSLGVLVPERFRDRHHGQVLGFIGERRQRSMNEGRDLSARRKDGSEFPADISLHSFELDGEGFAVATTRDMTERRRIERESRVAGEIQRAFLPTHAPSILGFDIGGVNCQADSTGGDFYDYLILSRNRIVVFLGDVSGHGFGAAILAAACRSYLRALINSEMDMVDALAVVNRLMYADAEEGFVTAMVICIDTATRVVEYINAGHPDGYLLDSQRSMKHRLCSSAPPLGIMEDVDYSLSSTVCQPGDRILIVSDGILEARSSRNVMLGEEGMLGIVRDHPSDDSAMAAENLCHEATKYCQHQPRMDDMTAVFVRCVGPGAELSARE
jgi:sigma-B regulation protein RsbU (phosphoserine phosphatase)